MAHSSPIHHTAGQTCFITLVNSPEEERHARLFVNSLRTYGGALRESRIWIFVGGGYLRAIQSAPALRAVDWLPLIDSHAPTVDYARPPGPVDVQRLATDDLGNTPVSRPAEGQERPTRPRLRNALKMQRSFYLFAEKVCACAQAEALASADVRTVIWVNPECLVVKPPMLLELSLAYDVAFRPVHLKNVGLLSSEPLDAYWARIYAQVGLEDIAEPPRPPARPYDQPTLPLSSARLAVQRSQMPPRREVLSFVDGQVLRPYFNTHTFSFNPSWGLMRAWLRHFRTLAEDQAFQSGPCADDLHQIFLHQAVLSALVTQEVEWGRIRILPPAYSYPLHLHRQTPQERRALSLNSLVCAVYEDEMPDPRTLRDLAVDDPLRSWLLGEVTKGEKRQAG
jgi:hypothetical protein